MSIKSLLVFLILLFSAVAMAGTKTGNPQTENPVLLADSSRADVQNFRTDKPQPFEIGADDDVCYRIRAYIFKRDDDHAPEFVRSTTCGPRKPHTKDAKWPDARIVPAK